MTRSTKIQNLYGEGEVRVVLSQRSDGLVSISIEDPQGLVDWATVTDSMPASRGGQACEAGFCARLGYRPCPSGWCDKAKGLKAPGDPRERGLFERTERER